MDNTNEALREELEHQKNLFFELNKKMDSIDLKSAKIVEVLIKELPVKRLNKSINVHTSRGLMRVQLKNYLALLLGS